MSSCSRSWNRGQYCPDILYCPTHSLRSGSNTSSGLAELHNKLVQLDTEISNIARIDQTFEKSVTLLLDGRIRVLEHSASGSSGKQSRGLCLWEMRDKDDEKIKHSMGDGRGVLGHGRGVGEICRQVGRDCGIGGNDILRPQSQICNPMIMAACAHCLGHDSNPVSNDISDGASVISGQFAEHVEQN